MNQMQVKVRKARKCSKAPPDLFSDCPEKKIYTQETINFET
jgi:hypothetical protein